jgi:hypothetical protein
MIFFLKKTAWCPFTIASARNSVYKKVSQELTDMHVAYFEICLQLEYKQTSAYSWVVE